LEKQLQDLLKKTKDDFLSGEEYMNMWGYTWDGKDSIRVQL
jgi:hypothetical protein